MLALSSAAYLPQYEQQQQQQHSVQNETESGGETVLFTSGDIIGDLGLISINYTIKNSEHLEVEKVPKIKKKKEN